MRRGAPPSAFIEPVKLQPFQEFLLYGVGTPKLSPSPETQPSPFVLQNTWRAIVAEHSDTPVIAEA